MKHAPRDMSSKLPGAFELIKPGFSALNVNIFIYLLLILITSLLGAVLTGQEIFGGEVSPDLISIRQVLLTAVISLLATPFIFWVQLKSARGERVSFRDVFNKGLNVFPQIIGINIAIALMVAVGLIAFIVPGLFILHRFFLAPYYLLDDNNGIQNALKQSARDARKYSRSIWSILGLALLLGLLSGLPLLNIVALILQFSYAFIPALRYHQIRADQGWKFDQVAIPPTKSKESA